MSTAEIVAALAGRNRHAERHGQTGINAALRRMNPSEPGAAATVAFRELIATGLELEKIQSDRLAAWLLIVHSLALARWRHDRQIPVGRGLTAMRLSENRIKQLLSADVETLRQLLPRLARRFASCTEISGMDFTPLAKLALAACSQPEQLERERLEVARSYTRFENETSTDKRKLS